MMYPGLSSNILRFSSKFGGQGQKLLVFFRFKSQSVQAEKAQRQIPREKPAIRRRRPGLRGYPLLIIPITTFALGTWQIYRRKWKLQLIKELEEKISVPSVSLPENLEELQNMEYCRVTVKGTFDHSRELFIGPRTSIHEVITLATDRSSLMGVNVVTPFKLVDRDETILVNRGHVTFKNRPPQMRLAGQVEGVVEITGVVRLNDKKSPFGNNPLKDGYWLTRDIDEMADITGTAKVFIDADINSTVPGGPVGGQTNVTLRNEHLTYIITWFSLFVLTSFLWFKQYRRPSTHKSVIDFIQREHKKL